MIGYIYFLGNESLEGLIKIGITSRNPFDRAQELHSSGVPTPFVVLAAVLVDDTVMVERALHKQLDAVRVNQGREFFRISVLEAIAELLKVIGNQNLIGEALKLPVDDVKLEENLSELQEALDLLKRGPKFNLALAEKILTKLAKEGNGYAKYHLALYYEEYFDGKEDARQKKVVRFLREAASENVKEAFLKLAYIDSPDYLSPYLETEVDKSKAVATAFQFLLEKITNHYGAPQVCSSDFYVKNIEEIYKSAWTLWEKSKERESVVEQAVNIKRFELYKRLSLKRRRVLGFLETELDATVDQVEIHYPLAFEKLMKKDHRSVYQKLDATRKATHDTAIRLREIYWYFSWVKRHYKTKYVVPELLINEIQEYLRLSYSSEYSRKPFYQKVFR